MGLKQDDSGLDLVEAVYKLARKSQEVLEHDAVRVTRNSQVRPIRKSLQSPKFNKPTSTYSTSVHEKTSGYDSRIK